MTEQNRLPASRRLARRIFTAIVTLPLAACGSLIQVVDRDGTPVGGASVAPAWAFYGEWSTTDDEGYARIDDRWLGLAWSLEPKELVVRTANDEFHIAYPLPSPVRLPITLAPAPVERDAGR